MKTRSILTAAAKIAALQFLFFAPLALADTKISALPSASSVAGTDVVPFVASPGSSPVTKQATWQAVLNSGLAFNGITETSSTNTFSLSNGTASITVPAGLSGTLGNAAFQPATAFVPAYFSTNAQSGNYTFVLGDGAAGVWVTQGSGSASTNIVPPNSSVPYPVGTTLQLVQTGAGVASLVAGTGVTIEGLNGSVTSGTYGTLAGQYASCTVQKLATNTWLATGVFGPGPITVTTISGTVETLTATASAYSSGQLVLVYDGSHKGIVWVNSSGEMLFDTPNDGPGVWRFQSAGSSLLTITGSAVTYFRNAAYIISGNTPAANTGRFLFSSGGWLGDGGANNTWALGCNTADNLIGNATVITATVPFKPPTSIVSALPSAATVGAGAVAVVTDANSPTYGATVAGSGSSTILVMSDGTNWKCH